VDDFAVDDPGDVVVATDLVFLSVLGTAAVEVAAGARQHLRGKVLVDTTNPLNFSSGGPGIFVGHTVSLGEQVQRAVPDSYVVKA
jgi:predicted dinucleotide-binding enzyme